MKKIEVKLKDGSNFKGILIPNSEYIIIKLKKGYNVALDNDEILSKKVEEDK